MTQMTGAHFDTVLAALAAHQGRGRLRNRADLVPGVCASWDDRNGKVLLQYDTTGDGLLHLEGQCEGEPRWLTLQFDLGHGAVDSGSIIGLAAMIRGSTTHDLAPFIRTEHEGRKLDARLSSPMVMSQADEAHAVIDDKIMKKDQFRLNARHRLLVRLPLMQFTLTLGNLHLFLHAAPETSQS